MPASDVADEIRKAVQAPRQGTPIDPDEAFRKLHAHVWGVLIDTHRAITQREGAILEQDVRILNVVTAWMEDVRGAPMTLEEKMADDITRHVLEKVHTAIQHGVDIIPDGYEPRLILAVTINLLVGAANALAEGNPLMAKLPLSQQVVVITGLLSRGLPADDLGKETFEQTLSDTAAAMAEIKHHFGFRVRVA